MTTNEQPKVGGLLLAAGGSSRLGRPKQLVEYGGRTLIRRSAEALVLSRCTTAVVVLGAEINGSTRQLKGFPIHIAINADWKSGMGSSIRKGVDELLAIAPDLTAIVITLCDQPLVSTADIDKLIEKFCRSGTPIVASYYNGTKGVPAVFSAELFDDLRNLHGDKGARELIRNCTNLALIEIEAATVDIDSPRDI